MTEGEQVWLVLCFAKGPVEEETFAFSSYGAACRWANQDKRSHVIYSRVLDHPELAEMVQQ